jgi:hypothetical protein
MIARGLWGRLRCVALGKQALTAKDSPDSTEGNDSWGGPEARRRNEESLAFAHRLTHWYGHRCVWIMESYPCQVSHCGQWFCKERWWPWRR